jgi:hypothetical protein
MRELTMLATVAVGVQGNDDSTTTKKKRVQEL